MFWIFSSSSLQYSSSFMNKHKKSCFHITEREMGREETRTKRVSNEGWHEWVSEWVSVWCVCVVCVCVCVVVCVCVCVWCVCVWESETGRAVNCASLYSKRFHFNIWGRKRGKGRRYTIVWNKQKYHRDGQLYLALKELCVSTAHKHTFSHLNTYSHRNAHRALS